MLQTELCSPSHPIPNSYVKVLNPKVLVLGTEIIRFWRLPRRLRRKEYAWCRKADLTPGLGRSPGEGNGYPLQCSCLAVDWTEDPGGLSSMGSQQRREQCVTSYVSLWVQEEVTGAEMAAAYQKRLQILCQHLDLGVPGLQHCEKSFPVVSATHQWDLAIGAQTGHQWSTKLRSQPIPLFSHSFQRHEPLYCPRRPPMERYSQASPVRLTVSDEVSKLCLIIFSTTPSANCADSGCWGSGHWFRSMGGLSCSLWKTKVGWGWENQTTMQIWNLWREQGEIANLGMERCRCRSPLKGRSRASITCLEKVPHWAEGARPPQA